MSTLAPSIPALYSTVGLRHDDGTVDIGLVRSEPRIFPGITTVQVEWDHTREYGVTEVNVDNLLTETRTCQHGSDPSARCDMDTAPGYDQCEAHGGQSPIHVEVRRA